MPAQTESTPVTEITTPEDTDTVVDVQAPAPVPSPRAALPEAAGEDAEGSSMRSSSHPTGHNDGERTVAQLEEEGDIAADYIEELLDITDLDGDIDIDARDGRAYVSVNSNQDSNLRILAKPDTVNALQELTRLAVQAKTGSYSRLILDVGGSRETRVAELQALVARAIERIEAGAESAALPPMSSYERKLVHDLVAGGGFTSQSEGEGRDRHTNITRG
ncbi:MAG: DNA-binding protein [Microbacteriaceae bacterium]|nr:DNA-binding protein [Microbacteriaceae bacterium]